MAIKFGATVFFRQPEEFNIMHRVSEMAPLLTYIEFRGEHPFLVPGVTPQAHIDHYKSVLSQTRLRSTFHATMYDVNLATLNPWLKDANIACYRRYLAVAAYLGAEVLVVHGGEIEKEFAEGADREPLIAMAEEHLCESLYELAEDGRKHGLKIALENLPPCDSQKVNVIWEPQNHLRILQRVNHSHLGALLDFGHAHLYGLNLIDYLEQIRPYLVELHAHNNRGGRDDHLPLADGQIDYRPILAHEAIHDLPFIMELQSYEDVMSTLAWIEEQLRAA